MTTRPDRLALARQQFYDEEVLARDVGVRFKARGKTKSTRTASARAGCG